MPAVQEAVDRGRCALGRLRLPKSRDADSLQEQAVPPAPLAAEAGLWRGQDPAG